MKKSVISCVSCNDSDGLWMFDEMINCLCKINKKSLQAEYIVSSRDIFVNEWYPIKKMIKWKDKLIMLPLQLWKKWIFIDIKSGEISHIEVGSESHESKESVIFLEKMVILPLYVKSPITVIDLQGLVQTDKIYIKDIGFGAESYICSVKVYMGHIYFLVAWSRYIGCLGTEGLKMIKMDVSEILFCGDFLDGAVWAIGHGGEYLYKFDLSGKLLDAYTTGFNFEITRIIAYGSRIIFMPQKDKDLWEFNTENRKFNKVFTGTDKDILSEFPEKAELPSYWDYMIVNEDIWIMPLKQPLIILKNGVTGYIEKRIEYNEFFSEYMYWKNYMLIRKKRDKFLFLEKYDSEIKGYLAVLRKLERIDKPESGFTGSVIWKNLIV